MPQNELRIKGYPDEVSYPCHACFNMTKLEKTQECKHQICGFLFWYILYENSVADLYNSFCCTTDIQTWMNHFLQKTCQIQSAEFGKEHQINVKHYVSEEAHFHQLRLPVLWNVKSQTAFGYHTKYAYVSTVFQ